MLYVVLVLGLTNLFLTAAVYRLIPKFGEFGEVEVWVGESEPEPFLQMIITEEPEPTIPESPPDPVPAPVPDGPWRNQKNIEPWAPTSSAQSGRAIQERGPLERPPGFV